MTAEQCARIPRVPATFPINIAGQRYGQRSFFGDAKRRRRGATVAEAEYTDEDGVLVSIVLNTDAEGALYEVDFWKVDFQPLRRYPSPSDLRIKKAEASVQREGR